MKTTTPSELKNRLHQVTLIDVRTPAEFQQIHIPGSRLFPLHQLDETKASELAQIQTECVIICRSGNRARQAAEKLHAAGAKNLTILEGGLTAWESAGQAVNRGKKTISIERQVRIAAGAFVLAGVLLGAFINPWFLILSGFVGCGLIFAGITDWCGMALLLARMPWNNPSSSCSAQSGASCTR